MTKRSNTLDTSQHKPRDPSPIGSGPTSAAEAATWNRRQFLEAAGFTMSLATLGGCGRAAVDHAFPAPALSAGMLPGQLRSYASVCPGCSAACGLVIGTRDGRPLKMEGLPEHPVSRGGLCAVGQALPIGLYDSHRLSGPLQNGKPADWKSIDQLVIQALDRIKTERQAVRVVTPTLVSPTLQAQIAAFVSQFPDGRHVVFDPTSSSAILDAHQQTHAARVLPHYRFDRATTIVSFGADFLGTWISPVEFAAAWSTQRAPQSSKPEMSFHVQFESRMSLTGSNADRRYAIHPSQQSVLIGRLMEIVATIAGKPLAEKPPATIDGDSDRVVAALAERLWNQRGKCLVVCDSQDVGDQRSINYINHLLGNYGATLDLERPSRQRQGNDRDVQQLIEELKADRIGALLVADVDLLHALANQAELAEAVDRVPLTISCAQRENAFTAHAKFVCPDHHPLESWCDAEPISGLVGLGQPTLRPLGNTRGILESLATWMGQPTTTLEALQKHWRDSVFPRRLSSASAKFADFWDDALRSGFVEITPEPVKVGEFDAAAIKPSIPSTAADDFTIVLYNKVGMPDARHAHNPWLQELPDPVTKATWGNYVCISPADADKLRVGDGDVVTVAAGKNGSQVDLPALVQVGQHDGTLAIALAYGVKGTDRFARIGPQWIGAKPTVADDELVGVNAAGLLEFRDGTLRYERAGATVAKTNKHRALATTQRYDSLELPANVAPRGAESRDVVERTTLAAFANDPHSGAAGHHGSTEEQLWPEDHPEVGHAWGMVIDLNKCTGCSGCVVACQVENNVPVVGYDEILRQREMHWLRIDRYYDGDGDDLEVAHQPMMCQHCGNAPCETVCPALATVHSSEGLNEQIYNRCVGTRYCANNCPYKVRRFNWFAYPHPDLRQNLVLNPEVTVRSRGVMEKCSMCVQRIEAGRIAARSAAGPIADGAVQTACQQSCPANAIVFGDLNDPQSAIHAAAKNPRRFRVLEELNVRPSVSYLRVVTNRDEEGRRG